MPANPYKDQQKAFARLQKMAEHCKSNDQEFDTKFATVDTLASFAVSKQAVTKYIDDLKDVYGEVKFV